MIYLAIVQDLCHDKQMSAIGETAPAQVYQDLSLLPILPLATTTVQTDDGGGNGYQQSPDNSPDYVSPFVYADTPEEAASFDDLMNNYQTEKSIEALEALCRELQPFIYRHAYSLTGNADDAADVMQEVFIKLMKSAERFERGTVKGWTYVMIKNAFLDSKRKEAVRVQTAELIPEYEKFVPRTNHDDVPIEQLLGAAAATDMLAEVEPMFRAPLELTILHGLSSDQAAIILGIPSSTVRTRTHRGVTRLRQKYGKHASSHVYSSQT